MGIRPKLIVVFLALGFAPMVVLGVMLHRRAVRSVEADLRQGVVRDATGIAREIDTTLSENEAALVELARSSALRKYLQTPGYAPDRVKGRLSEGKRTDVSQDVTQRVIPEEVQESIRAFLLSKTNRYVSLSCLSPTGRPLFRAESVKGRVGMDNPGSKIDFRTENFIAGAVDPRVWNTPEQTPLRSPISRDANGASVRYSVPVFVGELGAQARRGVLIAELNGATLFNDATIGRASEGRDAKSASDPTSSQRVIIVLDRDGGILYHSNEALRYQNIDSVMPSFKSISSAMMAGESGWNYYDNANAKWLVAYHPINTLGVSVGVADNFTAATSSESRLDWITISLFFFFGLATVVVFSHILRNTARSIERVTEGAVAIAGGRLEQRIEVRSNDETRLLAESFNKMTDRLREQIARETESRQFESFMRLSAMLAHDLKNAIAGLSLLVGNMEKQFHREEFRADAMKSLTEAADRLRRLVAKLSEPMLSLSSEHKMARATDLVVMIKTIISATVEPAQGLHDIEVDLPETLIATVEADRIEKVFENLIINAIEAMGAKSGKLTIQAGEVQRGEVFFRVSDTGPGMSDEFQRVKLFRPFATTKKSGIGLGLYTCREIVNAHGGHIDVESKRGSGATFRVVLPSEPKFTGSA